VTTLFFGVWEQQKKKKKKKTILLLVYVPRYEEHYHEMHRYNKSKCGSSSSGSNSISVVITYLFTKRAKIREMGGNPSHVSIVLGSIRIKGTDIQKPGKTLVRMQVIQKSEF
jgi:hypothetical protein